MQELEKLLSMWLPVKSLFSIVPTATSTQAQSVDNVYSFLIWTCSILFLLVVGPAAWFCIKYRRRHENQLALTQKDHNVSLEVAWTLLPCIYLAVLFVWGFSTFLDLYTPPLGSKQLHVIGQKWNWSVSYPDDDLSVAGQGAVIGLELNKPVELRMSSQDVIHSFYIPNFRVKQDVVPGRYTTLWFEPTEVGEFPVLCAEYCGDQHSSMLAKIKVMASEDYRDWVEKAKGAGSNLPPKERGAKLYEKMGCNACHALDSSVKIGPGFHGIYGKKQELTDGRVVTVNDDYIRKKILQPGQEVAKGFAPVMPSFQGRLKNEELDALVEFIKSLK
jgi:cytochrome c oxidase subunit 2